MSYESVVGGLSPQAYFPMQEQGSLAVNAAVRDASGNGLHGSVQGGAGGLIGGQTGPWTGQTAIGNYFTASAQINLPNAVLATNPPWSVITWAYWDTGILGASNWRWMFNAANPGGWFGGSANNGGGIDYTYGSDFTSATHIEDSTWHLNAFTLDGSGNLILWRDAVNVGSWSGVGHPTPSTPMIGQRGSNVEWWPGKMCHLATFNRILSQTEMSVLLNEKNTEGVFLG